MDQVEVYRKHHRAASGTARGLGWGSERAQLKRFAAACEVMDLKGLTVLDVGCGYGDLVPFVVSRQVKSYRGVDLLPEYVAHAEARWGDIEEVHEFRVSDVSDLVASDADVVFAIGASAFMDRDELATLMETCFKLSGRAAVISAITSFTPGFVDTLDHKVLTLDPGDLAAMASKVSRKFALRHDYLPTDQMVYLYH